MIVERRRLMGNIEGDKLASVTRRKIFCFDNPRLVN